MSKGVFWQEITGVKRSVLSRIDANASMEIGEY